MLTFYLQYIFIIGFLFSKIFFRGSNNLGRGEAGLEVGSKNTVLNKEKTVKPKEHACQLKYKFQGPC